MLQVTFVSGGLMSGPRMNITPFGRAAPPMSGPLVETAGAGDGKHLLKIVDLAGFRDLYGPLDTVACVAMQVGQAQAAGRVRIFAAGTAAFNGDSWRRAVLSSQHRSLHVSAPRAAPASRRGQPAAGCLPRAGPGRRGVRLIAVHG
jgi:hypothetical protein